MNNQTYYHGIVHIDSRIAVVESSINRIPFFKPLPTSIMWDPLIKIRFSYLTHQPSIKDWRRFGSYYRINPHSNQVFYDYPAGPLRLRLLVDALGSSSPSFCVSKNFWRLPFSLGTSGTGYQLFLIVLYVSLLSQQHIILHGASLSNKKKESALITCPSETGKTVTSLLGAEKGYLFNSEDLVVCDGVHLFPAMSSIKYRPFSFAYLSLQRNIGARMRRLALKPISLLGLDNLAKVRGAIGTVPPPNNIETAPTRLTHLFILSKESMSDSIECLSKHEAIKRLRLIQRSEFPWETNLLVLSSSYFHDTLDLSALERKQNTILETIVENAECYICRSSNPYHFIQLISDVFPLS